MTHSFFSSRRSLFKAACALAAAGLPALAQAAPGRSIVILFSRTGNTAFLAETVAKEKGFPLLRLQLQKPYASNYSDMTDIARDELRRDARREISTRIPDLSGYSNVFIATPLWWGHAAIPMRTFLKDHPLAGKNIFPIITSGSSTPEDVVADIRHFCPKAGVRKEFWVPGSRAAGSRKELLAWLKASGF